MGSEEWGRDGDGGRHPYPIGPGEMMVADVADTVKSLVVGDMVVGTAREDSGIGPSLKLGFFVGDKHVIHHFFTKKEHGVGVGGESGVFAYVGEHVQYFVLS